MKNRHNFIDWLKAIGMFLIVSGHIAVKPFDQLTLPVNYKQLGVAFFIFIMGWSLANEKRDRWQVLFSRIFPVYFWGITIAVALSCIVWVISKDLNLSNYMPFVLGINVFVNYFPANPTTWYIGTYLHVLLLWAIFFHGFKVTPTILGTSLLVEIVIRAVIISTNNYFIAYMVFPNWMTLFFLGAYLRNRSDIAPQKKELPLIFFYWVALVILWVLGTFTLGFNTGFPFKLTGIFPSPGSDILTSALVSIVYLSHTWLFFELFRRIPANKFIRFLSRNTLFIFICHMPLIYALSPWFYSVIPQTWLKKSILIILLYFGLAAVSELLNKIINMKAIRQWTWTLVEKFTPNRWFANSLNR